MPNGCAMGRGSGVFGEGRPGEHADAVADQHDPETLTIYHNGRVVLRSPANTGIPVAPTVNGTFPVFARYNAAEQAYPYLTYCSLVNVTGLRPRAGRGDQPRGPRPPCRRATARHRDDAVPGGAMCSRDAGAGWPPSQPVPVSLPVKASVTRECTYSRIQVLS